METGPDSNEVFFERLRANIRKEKQDRKRLPSPCP